MFTLRFDMRAPDGGAPATELYAAAVEMCAWAETRGAVAAVLSEHHGALDGHLPVPVVLASALAARTERLAILLAAVVLPLYDPVRLAEEIAVLDVISAGRVSYVLGVGHRAEEYEHFGVDFRRRGRLADEKLALLLELLKGGAVAHEGRHVQVTPAPMTPGGPRIMIAGASPAAVRRAARHGLGFLAQAAPPGLKELYEAECRAHGHEPGPAQFPDRAAPTAVFVADDVDTAWEELGPYLLHDAVTAAAYRPGGATVASISRARSVAELRAENGAYRIFTVDEAVDHLRTGRSLGLLPLCGGLPPRLAWPYLRRAAEAVALAAERVVPA
ncbi:LLM class flavin-dependent oxidoreductase [Frankia sp. CNm7]|uniref:LLM class flavin-dependent oxidoreductase n=1 Tax=Frankia nepalensis TaxID=1836974 RepID=A0A937UQF2_9ACTN|nr:LLM class flavin-dependent oxidoreductase [Frankia nepalensis]MBL7500800.1 LLM class flavin-dependent oxidoreductase [Frankia nepalensis]MBL7512607.1 LLM class flavin-dependent oxidoreductase [Frankia nepalensis]MBL7523047.1 LLM class flavin-dependent oxidoreductase [Frankia nepalensis]MBL7628200.1 LLM class flavin-dependent oxidoreductase [Frankia nepalensis]